MLMLFKKKKKDSSNPERVSNFIMYIQTVEDYIIAQHVLKEKQKHDCNGLVMVNYSRKLVTYIKKIKSNEIHLIRKLGSLERMPLKR